MYVLTECGKRIGSKPTSSLPNAPCTRMDATGYATLESAFEDDEPEPQGFFANLETASPTIAFGNLFG